MSSSLAPTKHGFCSSNKECHEFELKPFTKLFQCDGCNQKGSGPRYVCHHCGYELHNECMLHKPMTSHDFLQGVLFQFFEEPQLRCGKARCDDHDRTCDACTKDISGFNYQSTDKKWDLHPCCSRLEKEMVVEDTVFELRKKVLSKCIWCQGKKVDKRGWSYVSKCGEYHFHVHCIMKMVHHAKGGDGGGNGLVALEKFEELKQLAYKSKKNPKRGGAFVKTIKLFLKVVLSVLLGDPTALIATTVVELIH